MICMCRIQKRDLQGSSHSWAVKSQSTEARQQVNGIIPIGLQYIYIRQRSPGQSSRMPMTLIKLYSCEDECSTQRSFLFNVHTLLFRSPVMASVICCHVFRQQTLWWNRAVRSDANRPGSTLVSIVLLWRCSSDLMTSNAAQDKAHVQHTTPASLRDTACCAV